MSRKQHGIRCVYDCCLKCNPVHSRKSTYHLLVRPIMEHRQQYLRQLFKKRSCRTTKTLISVNVTTSAKPCMECLPIYHLLCYSSLSHQLQHRRSTFVITEKKRTCSPSSIVPHLMTCHHCFISENCVSRFDVPLT